MYGFLHQNSTAICHKNGASILVATGRPQEAIDFYRSEIKRQEELLTSAPKPEGYIVRGLSYKNRELANLLQQLNGLPEAEAARRRAVQYFVKLAAQYPSNDGYRQGLLEQRHELDTLSQRLGRLGNVTADGRPILGLEAKHTLELTLEIDPQSLVIPAHIWTPWFSVLGAKSGFDSLEECFEEYLAYIYALETGLSSDPPMNWRVPPTATTLT